MSVYYKCVSHISKNLNLYYKKNKHVILKCQNIIGAFMNTKRVINQNDVKHFLITKQTLLKMQLVLYY